MSHYIHYLYLCLGEKDYYIILFYLGNAVGYNNKAATGGSCTGSIILCQVWINEELCQEEHPVLNPSEIYHKLDLYTGLVKAQITDKPIGQQDDAEIRKRWKRMMCSGDS